mmetsp:Transcript_57542/g.161424  ORF Transcript_57542/g.161424 Transcript_57542/m.161424 type:complete len:303 (-) Transcript_57542:693-1601(-)
MTSAPPRARRSHCDRALDAKVQGREERPRRRSLRRPLRVPQRADEAAGGRAGIRDAAHREGRHGLPGHHHRPRVHRRRPPRGGARHARHRRAPERWGRGHGGRGGAVLADHGAPRRNQGALVPRGAHHLDIAGRRGELLQARPHRLLELRLHAVPLRGLRLQARHHVALQLRELRLEALVGPSERLHLRLPEVSANLGSAVLLHGLEPLRELVHLHARRVRDHVGGLHADLDGIHGGCDAGGPLGDGLELLALRRRMVGEVLLHGGAALLEDADPLHDVRRGRGGLLARPGHLRLQALPGTL